MTGFFLSERCLRVDGGHEPACGVRLVCLATSRTELAPVGRGLPGIGSDGSLTFDVHGAGAPESLDVVLKLVGAPGPPPVSVIGATLNVRL